MISTLTPATLGLIAAHSFSDSLTLIGFLVLLTLLLQKEIASVADSRFEFFSKALNLAIAPLMMAFVLSVVSKVLEVIQ